MIIRIRESYDFKYKISIKNISFLRCLINFERSTLREIVLATSLSLVLKSLSQINAITQLIQTSSKNVASLLLSLL